MLVKISFFLFFISPENCTCMSEGHKIFNATIMILRQQSYCKSNSSSFWSPGVLSLLCTSPLRLKKKKVHQDSLTIIGWIASGGGDKIRYVWFGGISSRLETAWGLIIKWLLGFSSSTDSFWDVLKLQCWSFCLLVISRTDCTAIIEKTIYPKNKDSSRGQTRRHVNKSQLLLHVHLLFFFTVFYLIEWFFLGGGGMGGCGRVLRGVFSQQGGKGLVHVFSTEHSGEET